jgi:hypothetical protein
MRVVSTMIRISATSNPDGGLMDRITNFARQREARGFSRRLDRRFAGPRPRSARLAPGPDGARRGDLQG